MGIDLAIEIDQGDLKPRIWSVRPYYTLESSFTTPFHKSRPSSGWKQKIRAPPPSAVIDRMFNVMFGRLSFVPDL